MFTTWKKRLDIIELQRKLSEVQREQDWVTMTDRWVPYVQIPWDILEEFQENGSLWNKF